MHYSNSFIAIISGSILGIYNYFVTSGGLEIVHVFVFGLLGGAGGYIGKLIIQKIHSFLKRN